MNLRIPSQIKNKLKSLIGDKEILDIVLFGSTIRGKSIPRDIDIALITNKNISPIIKGFHISIIKPEEFFKSPPTIATTLLREGFSLKKNRFLAETLNFKNKILFIYILSNLNLSKKVKIVNILRGKNKQQGLVEQYKGEWLANQVFITPIESSHTFEQFFLNLKIKFKKYYILIY